MRAITLVAVLIPLLLLGVGSAHASTHDRAARVLKHSSSFRARVQAAFAIGSIDDEGTEQARQKLLVHALRDRHPAVRAAAASSLAKIGDTRSLAALRRLRDDGNQAVRSKAADAVSRISARIAASSPQGQVEQLKQSIPKSGLDVGEVDARVARYPKAVAALLRSILAEELRARRDLRRARAIRINARVVRLDFRRAANGTHLYGELALILIDRENNNMLGSASARVRISGPRNLRDRGAMLRESLREASRAALSDLSGVKLALR